MKVHSRNSLGAQVQSLGRSLAIVFEFIGMLGFAGLVGYALQTWVWPEHSAAVFMVCMMAGLAMGIWHIVQRMKEVSSPAQKPAAEKKPPTISMGEKSIEDLRELRRKLDEMGGGDSR